MRILIVEDDNSSLELARRVVVSMGHAAIMSRDGLEGLAVAHSERPDLVLLDLHLPGISGVDLVRALRADNALRTTPVIAVSAASLNAEPEAMAAGCDEFVSKPYELQHLRDAIRRHLPAPT
jgi:CheY-like chemotaxis protein